VPRTKSKDLLLASLEGHSATVAMVGLGYVGLPLAVAMAEAGFTVTGIDRSEQRVKAINAGRSQIEDIESEVVERLVAGGRLRATVDFSDAAGADVAVIAVPTPIDDFRVPDLSAVSQAVQSLAGVLKPGSLVVLESTTYPGTTEEIVIPALRAEGFQPGTDIFVGYSPERIDPGNQTWNVTNTPKVVSGFTKDCIDVTIAFYSSFVEKVVPVSSLATAEITKLFENIFRIVNIALVNEFQVICDSFGIDVWEVIEACSTKPYGFMPFYPGPGLGGHCVPVDPFYLAWKAREKRVATEFIELAGRISSHMPAYIVGKVAAVLNAQRRSLNASRIAVLGVAYKKNTSDVRESPAIRIIELLERQGAQVTYHDPHVPMLQVESKAYRSQPLSGDYLSAQDCVLVLADHDRIDWTLVLQYAPMVVDTRNVMGRISPAGAARKGESAAVGWIDTTD
jgi:UDP-N-acetyl-D-glucosamine dehydrogenase